ncbi:hypothetical protein ACEWY4_022150 [Coilia grayii]|uniref:Uncharacterized protein n=1 Tax=Coilia grayii TaxID=363190 RepID=A0ABD1J5B6_9TELE
MAEGPASIDEPLTDQWDLCEDAKETDCSTVRFFSKVPGDIQKHIHDLRSYLKVPYFTEVSSSEWCDVILNFCPVDSNATPPIEKVVDEIPDWKPAILVLMHHTADPDYDVNRQPDNSGFANKGTVHIVNFLYHEDEGLLKCPQNDKARTKFLEALESFEKWDKCEDAENAECPSVRFHSIVPGSVKKHISTFNTILDENPDVTSVSTSQWSDVTLAFCPIVSRVGTDIEAALKNIKDSKPSILVAMHHTFDHDYVIPDTRRFGKSKNVLIVDCLFHEDLGLLRCKANEEAHKVIEMQVEEELKKKHLEEEQKKRKTSQTSEQPDP